MTPVWTADATDEWTLEIVGGDHDDLDPRRPLVPILTIPVAQNWREGADYTVEPAEGEARWYEAAPAAWRELILDGGLVALRGGGGWAGIWTIDTSHINAARFFLRTGAKVADLRPPDPDATPDTDATQDSDADGDGS